MNPRTALPAGLAFRYPRPLAAVHAHAAYKQPHTRRASLVFRAVSVIGLDHPDPKKAARVWAEFQDCGRRTASWFPIAEIARDEVGAAKIMAAHLGSLLACAPTEPEPAVDETAKPYHPPAFAVPPGCCRECYMRGRFIPLESSGVCAHADSHPDTKSRQLEAVAA